jgi:hypothetical protein
VHAPLPVARQALARLGDVGLRLCLVHSSAWLCRTRGTRNGKMESEGAIPLPLIIMEMGLQVLQHRRLDDEVVAKVRSIGNG